MALITIDRSCISDSEDFSSGENHELSTISDGHFLGENYLAVRGAAVILSNSDGLKSNLPNHLSGAIKGEIKNHLQLMIQLIRPQDFIKLAVRLEHRSSDHSAYMGIVSSSQTGSHIHSPSPLPAQSDETKESIILGFDIYEKRATIGLVLPLRSDSRIELDGDGGFNICTDSQFHNFKPISVQTMWSSIQYLIKEKDLISPLERTPKHSTFDHYESKINSKLPFVLAWHANPENIRDETGLNNDGSTCDLELQLKIRKELKKIMMTVDLEEVTSKYLRTELEKRLQICLSDMKRFIDDEMIVVMRQMEAPSKIFDFLYLGSEWNASNLDELLLNGVGYILNVTREIANFYPDSFEYRNIRIYDEETVDILRYLEEAHRFICKAKCNDSKILVHCKMGISRSATTVIAFVMKELEMTYTDALAYVRERRSCIQPNKAFRTQLETYDGILLASKQRNNRLWRTASLGNLNSPSNFDAQMNDMAPTDSLEETGVKKKKKPRCRSFLEVSKKSINVFLKMDKEENMENFRPLNASSPAHKDSFLISSVINPSVSLNNAQNTIIDKSCKSLNDKINSYIANTSTSTTQSPTQGSKSSSHTVTSSKYEPAVSINSFKDKSCCKNVAAIKKQLELDGAHAATVSGNVIELISDSLPISSAVVSIDITQTHSEYMFSDASYSRPHCGASTTLASPPECLHSIKGTLSAVKAVFTTSLTTSGSTTLSVAKGDNAVSEIKGGVASDAENFVSVSLEDPTLQRVPPSGAVSNLEKSKKKKVPTATLR